MQEPPKLMLAEPRWWEELLLVLAAVNRKNSEIERRVFEAKYVQAFELHLAQLGLELWPLVDHDSVVNLSRPFDG